MKALEQVVHSLAVRVVLEEGPKVTYLNGCVNAGVLGQQWSWDARQR